MSIYRLGPKYSDAASHVNAYGCKHGVQSFNGIPFKSMAALQSLGPKLLSDPYADIGNVVELALARVEQLSGAEPVTMDQGSSGDFQSRSSVTFPSTSTSKPETVDRKNLPAAFERSTVGQLALATLDPYEHERRRYVEGMRARQSTANYPELFEAATSSAFRHSAVYARRRTGSGLIVTALRQDALTATQRDQLSEFRLHQYALCGWYDLDTLAARHFDFDPAFDGLPDGTIHVLVGGPNDRLLSYFCMQPAAHVAVPSADIAEELLDSTGKRRRPTTLHDPWRPLFCMEVESFGPEVFPSLPAIADLPVDTMRELSCLIRNQAITSPLSALATVEAVYTMAHVVMQPNSGIDVTLGCIDIEARRVTSAMGIPFLYAPLAPVVLNQFDYYWASSVNAPGRFWPFVIATADLRAYRDHFQMLDEMLDGTIRDIRRGLVDLRRTPKVNAPEAFVPRDGESSYLWTADPYYSSSDSSRSDSLFSSERDTSGRHLSQ